MGAIYVRSCDDLPYGPGQSDYEYDKERQRKDDMDLGKEIFDQAAEMNRMAASYLKLGRQQVARDVAAWAVQNAEALKGAPVESLLALCNKELQ